MPRRSEICPTTNSRSEIATLRKDLFGLRFANATGELEDTAGIGRAARPRTSTDRRARARRFRARDDKD